MSSALLYVFNFCNITEKNENHKSSKFLCVPHTYISWGVGTQILKIQCIEADTWAKRESKTNFLIAHALSNTLLAQAVGVPVSRRSGGRLVTTLVATKKVNGTSGLESNYKGNGQTRTWIYQLRSYFNWSLTLKAKSCQSIYLVMDLSLRSQGWAA